MWGVQSACPGCESEFRGDARGHRLAWQSEELGRVSLSGEAKLDSPSCATEAQFYGIAHRTLSESMSGIIGWSSRFLAKSLLLQLRVSK